MQNVPRRKEQEKPERTPRKRQIFQNSMYYRAQLPAEKWSFSKSGLFENVLFENINSKRGNRKCLIYSSFSYRAIVVLCCRQYIALANHKFVTFLVRDLSSPGCEQHFKKRFSRIVKLMLVFTYNKHAEQNRLPALYSVKSLWCSNELILLSSSWTSYWIINNTEECQGLSLGDYLQRSCRCRGGKKSSCVLIQVDSPLKYSFLQSPPSEFSDNYILVFFSYSWFKMKHSIKVEVATKCHPSFSQG